MFLIHSIYRTLVHCRDTRRASRHPEGEDIYNTECFWVGRIARSVYHICRGDARRTSLQVIPFSVDQIREAHVVETFIHSIPHLSNITEHDTYNE